MRKALVVGIDGYSSQPLTGSVADANAVATVLSTNGDGSPNFENIVMTSATEPVMRHCELSVQSGVSGLKKTTFLLNMS